MFLLSKAAISSGMKPSVFVAYRQALAALVLAPFAYFVDRTRSHRLSFYLLIKIFIVCSCGMTMSLNLHYVALNYISATFATAITNTIPAMVFTIAILSRIENLAIRKKHGWAKILGSVLGISGAMVFTFYKGPHLYSGSNKEAQNLIVKNYSKEEWIKGSLLLLGSNLTWSIWLVMQAPILKEYPAKLRLTTLQCGFSCLVSAVYGAIKERDISSWKLGWNINLLSLTYSVVSLDARMTDGQSDACQSSRSAQLVSAWRGRFAIPKQNLSINVAAHVSNNACLEVARIMPDLLSLEIVPRIDIWPASFKSSPPDEHSVTLFFLPEERDEEVFNNMLTYAMCGDFALKATIGKAELLVFTSIQLPGKLHRLQGNPYLWGVFKGQRVGASHQSGNQLPTQTPIVRLSLSANSCGHRSFDEKESVVTISSKYNPLTHAPIVDRRGRRLDDAWQHANSLDPLRQKAECKYCGFVSSHGGISRLKAHLGGGHPKIRLPCCEQVPSHVKEVMSDWFNDWVYKTKALWTNEIRAWPEVSSEKRGVTSVKVKNVKTSISSETKGVMSDWSRSLSSSKATESQGGEQSDRRGKRLDNAWQHAKVLDEARQKPQCNYCGFISTYGGILRLKTHLAGGSAEVQLQGCPRVPLEIKSMMEEWFNEWVKYASAAWTKRSQDKLPSAQSNKRGRPYLADTWEHDVPLDKSRQATKCKYCGFVSSRGGIAQMRAHLGGGDLTMQFEGCPYVPPEVKNLMTPTSVIKKCKKKSKTANVEIAGGWAQETVRMGNETYSSEKRHHILQETETIDGVHNTCLKESLQKLIHEKNANMQKMQFEIHSLQNRLASMP
ncbi:WAT1-related protein [Striga hermonthica]|uniref:WAT1-related protein n=1 Tax=Striga hermonthica TaxID=68872 RepID=A0A9N7MH62_STRHE|nr:WAT1-related protein [Striga hermonthica]